MMLMLTVDSLNSVSWKGLRVSRSRVFLRMGERLESLLLLVVLKTEGFFLGYVVVKRLESLMGIYLNSFSLLLTPAVGLC